MQKYTFVIENGQIGSNGDMIDIATLQIPKTDMPLLIDFHLDIVAGTAHIYKEDGALKMDAEIDDTLLDTYPAIGIKVDPDAIEENGVRVWRNAEMISVSLSQQKNMDESIKTLKDQLGK